MKLATWVACVGVVAGPILAVASIDAVRDSRIDFAFADLDVLRRGVDRFAQSRHRFPTAAEGLDVLEIGTDKVLDHVPSDPWGRAYIYRTTPGAPGFEVHSSGLNGIDEHGAGDDLTTRDKSYRCEDYYDDCPLTPRWWKSWTPIAIFAASLAWLGVRLKARLIRI